MNYIKELNRFKDWAMTNRCRTSELILLHALYQICNMCGWKEWFNAPNQTIGVLTGLSRQSIGRARESLQAAGRVCYKPGSVGQAASYSIVSFEGELSDADDTNSERIHKLNKNKYSKSKKNSRVSFTDYALKGDYDIAAIERAQFEHILKTMGGEEE